MFDRWQMGLSGGAQPSRPGGPGAWLACAAVAAAALGLADCAQAVPVNISYAGMVTSNSGDKTDGLFPPGTRLAVSVQVDSDSLLTGAYLPAAGSADASGVTDATLPVDSAGSGMVVAVPGASARVYWFRGAGPAFAADGNPPSAEIWEWSSANLMLPVVADLDELLALTLDDMNQLIGTFGNMQLMTFVHSPNPNSYRFEYARTGALYEFAIGLAQVPEPPGLVWAALAGAIAAGWRQRRGDGRAAPLR